MPQIFTASADTWLRAVVLGTVVASFGGAAALGGYFYSPYVTAVGWPVDQPVPFSHKHHVTDDGIDCRYCHTLAETSASAGFPSTQTCITCHAELWTGAPMLQPVRDSFTSNHPLVWNRVSKLPDYVYFNHSIHVARGVPCVSCHGRVDQMPLMARGQPFQMRFCLDCHRHPERALKPPDQVTRMDWTGWDKAHPGYGEARVKALHIDTSRITNCETCHR